MRYSVVIPATAAALVLVVGGQAALAASSGSAPVQAQATMAATMAATPAPKAPTPEIVTLSSYKVALFASSTDKYFGPDSLVDDGTNIYIDYQNKTAKDCGDTNSSTVVEYTLDGKVVNTFSIPGHSDGMRMDPATGLLWTTSCEDGNAKFAIIDPKTGTVTPYVFPKAPHGGGYDDLYFLNGKAYIAASAPANSPNTSPAVDEISLGKDGKVVLNPILKGNAQATDLLAADPKKNKVTLNLTDPDSLTVDDKGNLVLVSQGDSEIIIISNPGAKQTVSMLTVGSQLDDTVWATSAHGSLLVSDGVTGNTYWVKADRFVPGTIYTQTPNDSGVVGMLGTVDPATGFITPIAIGFGKPTGMLFVPAS